MIRRADPPGDAVKKTDMATGLAVDTSHGASLRSVSLNRLACLLRHWAWADEAMRHFERVLAGGWESADDPSADHLFGAYYHWCALLCGLTETALEHGTLSAPHLDPLRPDLDACLPELRACRQLLVVIPESREQHPRVVDLLRDYEALNRIRRIHYAFGHALRTEQMARELDSLDAPDR